MANANMSDNQSPISSERLPVELYFQIVDNTSNSSSDDTMGPTDFTSVIDIRLITLQYAHRREIDNICPHFSPMLKILHLYRSKQKEEKTICLLR
jgi:hypothetical protein